MVGGWIRPGQIKHGEPKDANSEVMNESTLIGNIADFSASSAEEKASAQWTAAAAVLIIETRPSRCAPQLIINQAE